VRSLFSFLFCFPRRILFSFPLVFIGFSSPFRFRYGPLGRSSYSSLVLTHVYSESFFKLLLTSGSQTDAGQQSMWMSMLHGSLVQAPPLGVRGMRGRNGRKRYHDLHEGCIRRMSANAPHWYLFLLSFISRFDFSFRFLFLILRHSIHLLTCSALGTLYPILIFAPAHEHFDTPYPHTSQQ